MKIWIVLCAILPGFSAPVHELPWSSKPRHSVRPFTSKPFSNPRTFAKKLPSRLVNVQDEVRAPALLEPEKRQDTSVILSIPVENQRPFRILPSINFIRNLPWPNNDWSAYHGSANYRWKSKNELSPIEKYAKAFNLDASTLAEQVSGTFGIDAHKTDVQCRNDSPCKIGYRCAIKNGETKGFCVPVKPHLSGWATASILESSPLNPVSVNGVVFEPNDIKALFALLYTAADNPSIRKIGQISSDIQPFNLHDPRYWQHPHISADLFHLTLADSFGRNDEPIIINMNTGITDSNVYHGIFANRNVQSPIISYTSTHESVDQDRAMALMNGYFRGKKLHPPTENEMVTFAWTLKAKSYVHVSTTLSYLNGDRLFQAEVSSFTTMSRVSYDFLRPSFHAYILGLDDNGDIIGGEWVKGNAFDYVNFLAKPVNISPDTKFGDISYENVKMLLDLSNQ